MTIKDAIIKARDIEATARCIAAHLERIEKIKRAPERFSKTNTRWRVESTMVIGRMLSNLERLIEGTTLAEIAAVATEHS